MIKDSGTRRKFESGAVRDIAEGKGRCDLLPLLVVKRLVAQNNAEAETVIDNLDSFIKLGDLEFIYNAINIACEKIFKWDIYTSILEVSKQYQDGCSKYGERNWEMGIPTHCYFDSGLRHFIKYLRGDTDERHDRAFLWNMYGLIWTKIYKSAIDDLPYSLRSNNK